MCLWLQLDLSNNELCGVYYYNGKLQGTYNAEGITAIANALKVTASLTSLNLADNALCGIKYGRGTYNSEGIKAIAEALKVTASLTCIDVHGNNIAGDGASQLSAAVLGNTKIEVFNEVPIKEMRADSFTELNLEKKRIGVEGGMVVAGLLPVMASLTSINLGKNDLGVEGTKAICEALKSNKMLKELDLSGQRGIGSVRSNIGGPAGAKHVADLLGTNASLTLLSLGDNDLGDDGVEALSVGLKESKSLATLDLHNKFNSSTKFGRKGAAALASAIAVVASLTSVSVSYTHLTLPTKA